MKKGDFRAGSANNPRILDVLRVFSAYNPPFSETSHTTSQPRASAAETVSFFSRRRQGFLDSSLFAGVAVLKCLCGVRHAVLTRMAWPHQANVRRHAVSGVNGARDESSARFLTDARTWFAQCTKHG